MVHPLGRVVLSRFNKATILGKGIQNDVGVRNCLNISSLFLCVCDGGFIVATESFDFGFCLYYTRLQQVLHPDRNQTCCPNAKQNYFGYLRRPMLDSITSIEQMQISSVIMTMAHGSKMNCKGQHVVMCKHSQSSVAAILYHIITYFGKLCFTWANGLKNGLCCLAVEFVSTVPVPKPQKCRTGKISVAAAFTCELKSYNEVGSSVQSIYKE